jgi:hypothetical protein
MIIVLFPEDLPKGANKSKPKLEDFLDAKAAKHLSPMDVVLYRHDDETLVLKGPDQN